MRYFGPKNARPLLRNKVGEISHFANSAILTETLVLTIEFGAVKSVRRKLNLRQRQGAITKRLTDGFNRSLRSLRWTFSSFRRSSGEDWPSSSSSSSETGSSNNDAPFKQSAGLSSFACAVAFGSVYGFIL